MAEARNINIPARFAVLMVCLLFLSGWRNPFDTPAARNRKANELYRQKKYDEALKKYSDAQLDAPDSAQLHYNLGTALFRKKDYKGAASEFQEAAAGHDHSIKSDALYNMGNARFNLQKFQEAVKAYEGVLKLKPEDKQAKHNLEVAKKLLEQQEQESHDHQDQNKDQEKDQKEDKKEDKEDKPAEDDKKDSKPENQQEKEADEEKKKHQDKALEKKDQDKTKDQQEAESADKKPLDKDQMSQEEARRILDALKNDELQFQQERFKTGREVEVEKDW